MKIYVVKNLLSSMCDQTFVFPTDELASVQLCPVYNSRSPIDEWQLVCVGSISMESCEIIPSPHHIVPWDTRRLTIPQDSVTINS